MKPHMKTLDTPPIPAPPVGKGWSERPVRESVHPSGVGSLIKSLHDFPGHEQGGVPSSTSMLVSQRYVRVHSEFHQVPRHG